jgi:peroxiredoxin
MKPPTFLRFLPCLMLLVCGPARGAASKVDNFQLLDQNGESHELHRQKWARAVVLFVTGNGCPIARQSVAELQSLRKEWGPQGVVFWMLNANPQDDDVAVRREASEFHIDFPILLDRAQAVAEAFGIRRTAEVLAIDPKDWTVFYRGAIDDRLGYGNQKPEAEHHFLADALREFAAGKPVTRTRSDVRGCVITFPAGEAVTYTHDVAPILDRHCVGCHSAGNIGPFAMADYEKVKGWAGMIREVLLERRMPPWPADPHVGQFQNPRGLEASETRTLLHWIAAGTPRGEGEDPLAAHPRPAPEPWPLGKPDVVVSMPSPFQVPATGVVPYQYFQVSSPLTEDVWLKAAVVKPGNLKVLHHALIFVRYPEALKSIEPKQNAGTAGFFTGYVPGTAAVPFPEGTGKFLPKGTEFVFQMHYAPTGKPESDRTEIGLYLLPSKPKWELRTRAVTQTELLLSPGDSNHVVQASYKFRREAVLHDVSPHMHVRGASFKYELRYPDGRSELLLSVPRWDFNWQALYRLKEPKTVPAGAELICSGSFDNSASNPANPDPKAWVIFGEQTTDEMFIGYYNIAVPPLEPVARAPKREREKE